MTKVSVIIPTYNRKDYVQEAIDSVLAQTYTDYEIIVVDDGSTDGTGEALQERYGNRIRYVWQKNQGESMARNRGIQMAQGRYIALLDSDDLWLPEKLARQVAFLVTHPDTKWVICQGTVIDAQGNGWPDAPILSERLCPKDLRRDLLLSTSIVGLASMLLVQNDILTSIGGFDSTIRYGEDWDLSIRLATQLPFGHIEEPLCRIRYHQNSQCRLRTWEVIEPTLRDRLRIIAKCFSTWPAVDEINQELRRRVEAREYTDAALAGLAWGQYQTVSSWLIFTADAVQRQWINPVELADQFAQLLFEVQDRTGYYDPRELQLVFTRISESLATAAFDPTNRKAFTAQLLANVFFNAAERSDRKVLRWSLPRLLLIAPRWARNLGVWSLGLEAFLGTASVSVIRNLTRRRRNDSYGQISDEKHARLGKDSKL